MCIHGRRGVIHGCPACYGTIGPTRYFGHRYAPKRETIHELEEYQKDLEEEVLDVSERIKTLKGEA